MSNALIFEAEPFEIESETAEEHVCQCEKCRPQASLAGETAEEGEFLDELNSEQDEQWETVSGEGVFEEELFDEILDQEVPASSVDCASVATECEFLSPSEERVVRRAGKPEGDLLNRNQGDDPDKSLSLQLTDYDVNDWRAGQKQRHRDGLQQIVQFIAGRAPQIAASPSGIEITISGSASRTGSKQHNDALSCKRATCVAQSLRDTLSFPINGAASLLRSNKIKFTVGGNGFQAATCRGKECEIGEFRSVLISVHRPGLPPPPVPIVPTGWDKYRIRCCSFKTESLGEALISELIDRGIDALPDSLKRLLNESEIGRKVLSVAIRKLIGKLKDLLRKAPGALGRLFGAILKRIPIPVEFIRDTGVYQIVERDKANPRELILCYTGFGLRVLFPRELGVGIPLPEAEKEALKRFLKQHLKVEGLGVEIFFDFLSGKIPTISSIVPGPFTEFDVNEKISIKRFEGPGEALKGLQLGTIFVGFSSRRFVHPDPAKRLRLTCGRGCSPNLVPVTVGTGTGFEVVAPTSGTLVDGGCECGPATKTLIASRAVALRLPTMRRAAARRPVRRAVRR